MRGSLRRGEIIEKSFITQELGQVTKTIKLRNNLRMDEIWRVENERVERIGELKKRRAEIIGDERIGKSRA